MPDPTPQFTLAEAEAIAREQYGIDGTARWLTSERDQNVLLSMGGVDCAVLKIAAANEERAFLDAQQRAIAHVGRRFPLTPRILPNLTGGTLGTVVGAGGATHLVWAVTVLPGVTLGAIGQRPSELLPQFGRTIAELTLALDGFDDAAFHREFHWAMAQGRAVVAKHRTLVTDVAIGATIDALMASYDRHTAPLLLSLPQSVIHNDLNDHNVLVNDAGDVTARAQGVTGVIDFGDMVHGATIGELAVAIAYAMLDAPDPLSVMWQMVHGYHAARPLAEPEMEALYGLIVLRLCMSACLAAEQTRRHPDNEYLSISQAPLRRTLPRLARVPFAFAAATVRSACGLEPVKTSAHVRDWLAARTATFAPVIGLDLRTQPSLVLDLSIGSALIHGDASENAEPALTARVFSAMREAAVAVAIGCYDEPRLLYVTPAFAAGDGTVQEHRTIHIGLDLFAQPGTPVYAPLDGVVHAADYQAAPLDYGGVIMLRHTTDDGVEFFTLYGHLSPASFAGLQVGQQVQQGEQIATLGVPSENGGWTPHLHLQIITDLLERGSEFPGVGTPSRRDIWRSVSPDPNLIVGVPRHRFPRTAPPVSETLARRRALVGTSVRVAYKQPVRIVRGWQQYLYDDEGRRYLDAYNNVPHVGHCHPHVVQAAAKQMAVLSTNTRYLHDALEEYAERLAATLPDPLNVCYLVSSASEANELAIRLARAYTGRRDMLVLEAAYHGNTTTLIDISPYKHAGPGGLGAPEWVHVAPLADDYRGAYKRNDPDAGVKYARDLAQQLRDIEARGRQLAAFIAETCPSVGGQLFFPPGYLADVYAAVRAAGGLCIADEVQTGLGRVGTHCWAFQAHDVVPDMVVMGKPIGNGHPLAAVVTTRAIADAFDNGMEYFSTFGGNTVSCVVGNAVLDVMRDESLQTHADAVGRQMLASLQAIAPRHDLIGDVRGSGLFLGVELVRDHHSLGPADAEASYVSNRMREEGILLGTDGPYHNVVKIRPPMPFNAENADRLVETFDRVLGELRR